MENENQDLGAASVDDAFCKAYLEEVKHFIVRKALEKQSGSDQILAKELTSEQPRDALSGLQQG